MLSANYVFCAGGDDPDYSAKPPFNKLDVSRDDASFGRDRGSGAGKVITVKQLNQREPFGLEAARNNVRSIVIGSEITSLPNYIFSRMENLQNVSFELPSGLKDIGANAFFSCINLLSINIPDSVQTIGQSAFWGCRALASVIFESSDNLQKIGHYAFRSTGLDFITIPKSVTTIDGAFSDCPNLKVVTFEPGSRITEIGPETFGSCVSLQGIKLPDSVRKIGVTAFVCSGLTSITIPSAVEAIGSNAFYRCVLLRNVTFAKNSNLKKISERAFMGCQSLGAITLPPSVESIKAEAFADCDALHIVDFEAGSNLKTIGTAAFQDSAHTRREPLKINVPASVQKIHPGAFAGTRVNLSIPESCIPQLLPNPTATPDEQRLVKIHTFLNSLLMRANNPDTILTQPITKRLGEIDKNSVGSIVRIVKADGTDTEYTLTDAERRTWRYKVNEQQYDISSPTVMPINGVVDFGDGVRRLPEGEISTVNFTNAALSTIPPDALPNAFGGSSCAKITSVSINSSVTEIGPLAFQHIPLTSVNFAPGSQLTTIGDVAFASCDLKRITLPDTVTTIGTAAFINNPLEQIAWSNHIESIGQRAFFRCPLQRIDIPPLVRKIEESTFYCCTSLTTVNFSSSNQLRRIEASAFEDCTRLQRITIPAGVTSIGASAFSGCHALTSITFPAGIEHIGNKALAGCPALSSIKFGATSNALFNGAPASTDTRLALLNRIAPPRPPISGLPPAICEARFADSPRDVFELREGQWQHQRVKGGRCNVA
jgi:hypothetical protein